MARYKSKNPSGRAIALAAGAATLAIVGTYAGVTYAKNKKKTPIKTTPPASGGGTTPKRPPGNPSPFGGSCMPEGFGGTGQYDKTFWNSQQKILDAFDALGYQTPTDRPTMNALGGDGALGGGDDVSNPEVTRFQKEYNAVSRWGNFLPKTQMGGLDPDGLVGPCTLNGLKLVLDNTGDDDWEGIVSTASSEGFKP